MNSLIIIREKHYNWLRDLKSAEHPAMVTICNKSILEYLVDFFVLLECKKIRLVFEEPDETVEEYFGNGRRWGVEIDYGNFRAEDSITRIVSKNSAIGKNTPLIVLDGFLFFHYDKNIKYEIIAEGPGSGILYESEAGSLSFHTADAEGQSTNVKLHPDLPISSPRKNINLFGITMRILRDEQHQYVIPGYGADKGVILGRNVEIGKGVSLHGPVVIGSNVRLLGKAVVGPNAVVGNNVIIDDGSEVRDSVVMANTYIGRGLYISVKMVTGSRIISANNDTSLEIRDDFLLSPIKGALPNNFLHYAFNICGAFLLALFQFVPFCIIFVIRWLQGDMLVKKKRFLLSIDDESKLCRLPALGQTNGSDRIIRGLSLDKFALLKDVFSGKLQLVGNRLIPDTAEGRAFVKDFTSYMPGIFNYTEADGLEPGTAESEIAERYYSANRGLLTEAKSLVRVLLNNLLIKQQ